MTSNAWLPKCGPLPAEMEAGLRELGRLWAAAPQRPRIAGPIQESWRRLLSEWVESDLPLVVRKSGGLRGGVLLHHSGRELIVADNSPAHWVFGQAFAGNTYDLDGIRALLANDAIPFAFATKAAEKEKMAYRCTLSAPDHVGRCGWKRCHREPVGRSPRRPPEALPLPQLVEHFTRLMSPSNQFVVPLVWGGLGEVEEFIAEIRAFEAD
jgi:hypothetical protein